MIVLPADPAESGAVLTAVKAASRTPSAVASLRSGPALTGLRAAPPQSQVGKEKRCFDRTKKLALAGRARPAA